MCEITDETNVVQGKSFSPFFRLLLVGCAKDAGFAVFSPANVFGHTIGCVPIPIATTQGVITDTGSPIIGGWLANPVPALLSPNWKLFVHYPCLLPAVATSIVSWLVVAVAARYVPEV